MVQKIADEIEKRLFENHGYIEITMKRTGKKLYIYRQRYGIEVYDKEYNVFEKMRKGRFFPNAKNALKGVAEYILTLS